MFQKLPSPVCSCFHGTIQPGPVHRAELRLDRSVVDDQKAPGLGVATGWGAHGGIEDALLGFAGRHANGSREALIVLERVSLIVSVPNRVVITAVPSDDTGHAVFTNIDSAVIVPANEQVKTKQGMWAGPFGEAPRRGPIEAALEPLYRSERS